MRILLFTLACTLIPGLRAQLVNGSFEDALGNYSDSGWVYTCSVMPSPAAVGWGNSGILVPHSNAPGCGWSRLYQLVPAIGDGETWTLSGWCANFTWMWADPYSGFRFGIKDAQGNLAFNTAALQNTGNWTHLSVTNSFTLSPGDTVFVECDPGSVSGLGSNPVFAMFDGVELTSISTGSSGGEAGRKLHLYPNPATDRLWLAAEEPVLEVRAIGMDGRVERALPFVAREGTAVVDVAVLTSGAFILWVRTARGISTARFVRQ